MKTCKICNSDKELTEFRKRSAQCKKCVYQKERQKYMGREFKKFILYL